MEVTFAVRHIGVEHLGIMTLVAALKRAGHSARVVPAKIRAVERCLEGVQGPRLLALSAPTLDLEHYLALARRVCTRRPGTRIILGGPHPTFAPEVIREDGVEMICRGEGEGALVELADRLQAGAAVTSVPNLWVKDDLRVHENPLRPLVEDLDRLPWPDRECFPSGETFTRGKMHVMTSRGCPHACAYCVNPALRALYGEGAPSLRQRGVDDVIEEIKAAERRRRPALVMFEDDLFAASAAWTARFLERYRAELGLPFFCYLRPEQVTPSLAADLRSAGCVTVSMGLETADEDLRRTLLGRTAENRQIVQAAGVVKAAGLALEGLNIVGIPGAPPDTDLATARLNRACGVDYAAAKLLAPYPGTEVYRRAREAGELAEPFPTSGWRSSFHFADPRQRRAAENMRKLLGLAVEFPRLSPLIRLLLRVPLDRPLRPVFLLWEGYTAATRLYPLGPEGVLSGARKYARLLRAALGRS